MPSLAHPEHSAAIIPRRTKSPALQPVRSGMTGALSHSVALTEGGIHLISGPPGSRKSGLALQLALDRGAHGSRSLVLLSEESTARVRERAFRMLVGNGGAAN